MARILAFSTTPLTQVSQVIFLFVSSIVMALTLASDEPPGGNNANVQQVVIQKQVNLNQQRAEANARHVVSATELQQFADTSVVSVLQRQPGVNLVNGQISLRGLPASYTQILLNGEPAPAGFSLESVNPAMLERIEISNGVRADQSSQAIAGTINLIFKSSAASLAQPIQLQIQRGRTQDNRSLAHDLHGRQAEMEYGVRVQVQDNRYAGLEQSREQQSERMNSEPGLIREIREQGESHLRRWSLQPRLQAKSSTGEQWQLTSSFEQSRNQAHGYGLENTLQGAANDYPENSFQSDTKLVQGRVEGLWKRRLSEELRMQHKLAYWFSDRDIDYVFHGTSADKSDLFQRQVISNANEKKWQQSSQFNWNFQSQHSLAWGWSMAQTQRREWREQTDQWTGTEKRNASSSLADAYLRESYLTKIDQVAAFIQDEWDISDDWRSYLGLRWENLASSVDSHASIQQEGLIKQAAAVWSPVMNFLWRNPNAVAQKLTQQWRFSVGRSYKAPEPRQITPRRYTINNGNNPANADYAGNPNLRPELAWNVDLAYEYSWGEGTWLGLSAYAKRIQNVVVEDLIQYQQRWLLHPANLPAATVQGVELDLRTPLRFAPLPGKLAMRLHAAYHQSQLQNATWDHARLPGQLPYSWSYLLDYQHGQMQASLNWQVQAGGQSQANAWSSDYQTQRNSLELAWHYRFSPQLKLSLMRNQNLRGDAVQIRAYQDQTMRWQRTRINQDEKLTRLQLELSY